MECRHVRLPAAELLQRVDHKRKRRGVPITARRTPREEAERREGVVPEGAAQGRQTAQLGHVAVAGVVAIRVASRYVVRCLAFVFLWCQMLTIVLMRAMKLSTFCSTPFILRRCSLL